MLILAFWVEVGFAGLLKQYHTLSIAGVKACT